MTQRPHQNTNSENADNGEPIDADLQSDSILDQLLAEAEWPEAGDVVISRIQDVISNAIQEPSTEYLTANTAAESAAAFFKDSQNNQVSRAMGSRPSQRYFFVASVIAAIVLAFLAGRWSTPDLPDDVAAITASRRNDQQIKTPPSQTPESPLSLPASSGVDAESSGMVAGNTASPVNSPVSSSEVDALQPRPDASLARNRRLTQRERMQLQLNSVLECLGNGADLDASCCKSLLPRRAEFEYMLGEVIRNATGQRQMAAVTAIGFVGTDGSVPTLLRTTKSEDLRSKAIEAVKRCSSEQMLAGLVLQQGDESLRREFLTELAHRQTPKAALAWLHLVRSKETAELCLQLADELSPAMVDAMFADLDAPLLDDRMAAILSLGRRTDQITQERTLRLVQQFPNRWEPVAIMMWNGSETAVKTLTQLQRNTERFAVLQTAAIQLEATVGLPASLRRNEQPVSTPATHQRPD